MSHAASLPFSERRQRVAERHGRRRRIAPALVLDLAVLQAAIGQDDAVRHADQLPVGEHRAGTLAAIVEHDVDAGARAVGVQRVGGLAHAGERS